MSKTIITLAEETAEAAELFRQEAARHRYLAVADLTSLIATIERTADNLAHFLNAYTEVVWKTYAHSFEDIEPHTKATDLTGRANVVGGLVSRAKERMQRAKPPLQQAYENTRHHMTKLRKANAEAARGAGGPTLRDRAAALSDTTYALAREAYGLRFTRLTLQEHDAVVGNTLAVLDTLRTDSSGSSGHLAHIIYRAYSGTAVENDAHLTAVPFGTFGAAVKRVIEALRVLHMEIRGDARDIAAAAKALH